MISIAKNTAENPEENKGNGNTCLTEGDVICQQYQPSAYVTPVDQYRLWTKRIVPYKLHPTYYREEEISLIKEAMQIIEEVSCITFKELENENDYLKIEPQNGCYSYVGRIGGPQLVSLSPQCFMNGVGTPMHELMHSLGYWHEQNRYDRDNFVIIHDDNILPGKEFNFMKRSKDISDLQELDYDYTSILHYGPKMFAFDITEDTITPLDPKYKGVIGQRKNLSKLDVERLNKRYKCDIKTCEEPQELINGFRSGDDFSIGREIKFECEDSYELIGSAERFCRFDGLWSGFQPLCYRLNTGFSHDFCDFSHDFCGWAQDESNDLDWKRIKGPTPSIDTGPMVGHTTETTADYYIYVDSSKSRSEGESARIITPTLQPETEMVCLTAFYYMWGQKMGILNIYVRFYNKLDVLIWNRNINSGPVWLPIQLAFEVNEPIQIVFEGIVRPGGQSDIAIDDMIVEDCYEGFSHDIIEITKPSPPNPETVPSLAIFWCDFEVEFCGYSDHVDGEFNWIRNTGPTPTYATGPTFDHTFGTLNGTYLHLETSHPRMEGEKARFILPKFEKPGEKCLTFYYHLYGKDMGILRILMKQDGEENIWEKRDNLGDLWRKAEITFNVINEDFQIIFEGVCGPGVKGDAAIDDIAVFEIPCSEI